MTAALSSYAARMVIVCYVINAALPLYVQPGEEE